MQTSDGSSATSKSLLRDHAITDAPGWEVLVPYRLMTEVAAQPASAAKPAEDGLEAKIRAILKESVEACWKIKARGDDEVLGAFSRDVAAFVRTHQAARAAESVRRDLA